MELHALYYLLMFALFPVHACNKMIFVVLWFSAVIESLTVRPVVVLAPEIDTRPNTLGTSQFGGSGGILQFLDQNVSDWRRYSTGGPNSGSRRSSSGLTQDSGSRDNVEAD